MNNRTMMEIHIDALAYAAGIASPQHLAVSHAPVTAKAPRRRLRKRLGRLLGMIAQGLDRIAVRLETPEPAAYH